MNAALQKKVNISELGIMTKAEFMTRAKGAGWTVEAKELSGYQNGDYNRRHFNRLAGEDQSRYEEKMQRVKVVYSIRIPGQNSFYDITKTEYEYFKSLAN